jgi:hypothetical protein
VESKGDYQMVTLPLEEIVKRLKQRNLKEVANATDVSYMTICNIAKGLNKRPYRSTLLALTVYFEENP